ncbi:MAG: hypothetical protein CMM54_00385 [Rhodospirillaceae bacterium]|nr:hypothetical protein [Rhodospirillaceae bacterium]|tara:strand:- start:90 stop:353 length:264 start_codon:yes stop_codon:yes gene_type:complete
MNYKTHNKVLSKVSAHNGTVLKTRQTTTGRVFVMWKKPAKSLDGGSMDWEYCLSEMDNNYPNFAWTKYNVPTLEKLNALFIDYVCTC